MRCVCVLCVYSIANIRIHVVVVGLLIARIYLHAVPSCTGRTCDFHPLLLFRSCRDRIGLYAFLTYTRDRHTRLVHKIFAMEKEKNRVSQHSRTWSVKVAYICSPSVYTVMYILFAIRSCASLQPRWMSGGHADGWKEKLILRWL